MERLRQRGHKFCSANFKRVITEDWKAALQLVPPNMHCLNIAERAIYTFKAHFLVILSGIDYAIPRYLWDTLLPKTELALNLLRRSTLNLLMSAWEHFNGAFNFTATPMGLIGFRFTIHNKPSKQKYWDHQGCDIFYVGPTLEIYRCFKVVDSKKKATSISYTVKFMHSYLTKPTLTPKYSIIHAICLLTCALNDAPAVHLEAQL